MSAIAKQIEVKERPLVLRANEVRSVLEGRKTQERVAVKPQPDVDIVMAHQDGASDWIFWTGPMAQDMAAFTKEAYPNGGGFPCPLGKPGDRLWLREALRWTDCLVYDADREPVDPDQIPAGIRIGRDYLPMTHMPRWASRVTLEITNVRVERLQDISAADAKAEGVEPFLNRDATAWRAGFQIKWNEINAKRGYSWESNPWVFVIEFKRVKNLGG